ncbi:large ribosomal subunit protein bL19m-like [Convolutriloba macropyga]|uniref:large ribosomal subunit protein bL19m-like n=1 Tax=Convolutriloba macropyga TaxID=536237 RepID=UPI003F51FEE3
MLKLRAVSCSVCRFCAHNSKKVLIKTGSVEYFDAASQPRMNSPQVHSFEPTSSLIEVDNLEGHQKEEYSDELSSELPRVLYNDRETHPRDLPPEFVSNYPFAQSRVLKWLEWSDMMKRRSNLDIPEFYAGSILRVDYADPYATNGLNFFVGRVLYRSMQGGIRHSVYLRNVLEGEGVEMEIQLYSPRVHKITVLRLERWLDQDLLYLRNADPRLCTIPVDMKPEPIPEEVPVFTGKVKMMPKPWSYRWERYNLKNMDRSYLTTLDAERARRHVYYEYDRSKDIYDDATDQVSQRELRDIQKILAKGTSKPKKNRNSKSKQSDNVMNAA